MSRFSGKCDFYDVIEIHKYTLEELKNNVKIYVGIGNDKEIKIEKMSDLIPYYPYLISVGSYDNVERKSVIHLSNRSYVDIEERDYLEYLFGQVLRIYKRCKKKKIEFNKEDVIDELCYSAYNQNRYEELFDRISRDGIHANVDGMHITSAERYRKELVKEMIKNGLNPREYGYERFVDEDGKMI